jgi:hypothetical protein
MISFYFAKNYNKYMEIIHGILIGSIGPIIIWFIKERFDRHQLKKNNIKEIENIFMMAIRESEEAIKDLNDYIKSVKSNLPKLNNDLGLFEVGHLNRIYIDEVHIQKLKYRLTFEESQQIDIAVSDIKKFNSYLASFEERPYKVFKLIIDLMNLGIKTNEENIKYYKENTESELSRIQKVLDIHVPKIQNHILRPIAVFTYIKSGQKLSDPNLNESLDYATDLLLKSVKSE